MLILPAKQPAICVTCGKTATLEVCMPGRRTAFCDSCKHVLGVAFKLDNPCEFQFESEEPTDIE